MSRYTRWFPVVLACALILAVAPVARAQDEIYAAIQVVDSCSGSDVVLDVALQALLTPPADWVGWIIRREVVGKCVPGVVIGGPYPFVDAAFTLVDTPVEDGYATIYRAYAVDTAGKLHNDLYWGGRTNWAFADCLDRPAARGTVVARDNQLHVQVCPEECWVVLNYFIQTAPSEAWPYIGKVIDLYGELIQTMEGPVVQTTRWQYRPQGCGPIPVTSESWGALKARYR